MPLNSRHPDMHQRSLSLAQLSEELSNNRGELLHWSFIALAPQRNDHEACNYLADATLSALLQRSSQPLVNSMQLLQLHITSNPFEQPAAIPVLRQLRKKVIEYLSAVNITAQEAISIAFDVEEVFTGAEDMLRQAATASLTEMLEHEQHFNTRVTNTIPGIIFILDLFKFKEVYVNRNAEYFFGYSHEDLQEIGTDLMSRLIHPDDIPVLLNKVGDFADAGEGDIRLYEFRLKTRQGNYSWVRSYESVYRRTENGVPRQVIGIAIDITREKETSRMLERREQQLLQAQEIAGIGSFELEIESFTGEITPEAMNILDVSSSSSLSAFMNNVHPEDIDQVRATLVNAVETQGSYDLECRYKADSGYKAIWLRGTFQMQDNQNVLKGTVMDITARYNLLQQLKKSEQLYKQAEALSHLGNWNWNIDEDAIYWSDELFRIYGLEPRQEKISFTEYIHMVHPEDAHALQDTIARSLANRQDFEVNHRVLLKDGTTRYVQGWGEVRVDDTGKVVQMFGTAQDVTEKQLLLERLKHSEQLYKEAQALAHIGNWTWNTATNEFSLSDELFRIFEIPPFSDEFQISDFMKRFIPEEQVEIQRILQQAIADEKPFNFTHKYLAASGRTKTIKVLGEVRADPVTQHLIVIGTSQDITEQEQTEQALRDKQVELEQSNTSLKEYAYVASHDLQEPLRKISTFADRLRSSYANLIPEPAVVYLEKIISSSIRMQQMIHDLLSVSVISSERSFELVSIDRLFHESLQTFEHLIESRNVVVRADQLPEASVIPSQFRQLFQNLISNAIKFRKKEGRCEIGLTSEWVKEPSLHVRNPMPGRRYLKLTFSDNGIGFNNQFAEKIFTIFQRLHRKNEYEGTGIGLAICRRIAENHHGMIEATGVEGQGAVFTIIFPS